MDRLKNVEATCLVIEPFFGGSHADMVNLLQQEYGPSIAVYKLPATKWPWRARTSALHFTFSVVPSEGFTYLLRQGVFEKNFQLLRVSRTLFCSSVFNLAEFVALRPDVRSLRKVVYFHENQLVYPVQKSESGDFQFSYSQIISCLVADRVVFNTFYNMNSFLSAIPTVLKMIPKDGQPCEDVPTKIASKCSVIYYPVDFPTSLYSNRSAQRLHIIWPHRWEHDKNPDLFFDTLRQLKAEGFQFHLSVVGQTYNQKPECFNNAIVDLGDFVKQWGFVKDKKAYYTLLCSAHVVVSTANHEFFGVSMLEATYCGCWPICPDALAYKEIYPTECRYRTPNQLKKLLRTFCKRPTLSIEKRKSLGVDFSKYSWDSLKLDYGRALGIIGCENEPFISQHHGLNMR